MKTFKYIAVVMLLVGIAGLAQAAVGFKATLEVMNYTSKNLIVATDGFLKDAVIIPAHKEIRMPDLMLVGDSPRIGHNIIVIPLNDQSTVLTFNLATDTSWLKVKDLEKGVPNHKLNLSEDKNGNIIADKQSIEKRTDR